MEHAAQSVAVAVLDRNDVVYALDRIKRRRVIRLVNHSRPALDAKQQRAPRKALSFEGQQNQRFKSGKSAKGLGNLRRKNNRLWNQRGLRRSWLIG